MNAKKFDDSKKIDNKKLVRDNLDLEFLNTLFKIKRRFDELDICDNCCEHTCSCCGNEFNCGVSRSFCIKIEKSKDSFEVYKKEEFTYDMIHGLRMAVNSTRFLAILSGNISLEKLSEMYEGVFHKLERYSLKPYRDNAYYLVSECSKNRTEKPLNLYLKNLIDNSLKLTNDPAFLHSPDKPLIIQDDNHTILIAPRLED